MNATASRLVIVLGLVSMTSTLALDAAAAAPLAQLIVGTDLRDIADPAEKWIKPEEFPEAAIVLNSFKTETSRYFPAGITFDKTAGAAGRVYGVELSELPTARTGDEGLAYTEMKLVAFYGSESFKHRFRKLTLKVDRAAKRVLASSVDGEDIPVEAARFTITASLGQRKAILTDARLGIRKIYPIGAGGFDLGISRPGNRLMTPTFVKASLDRSTAIPARSVPEYYKGKPFIRLTTARGTQTAYAFHITQGETDRTTRGTRERMRGFYSHGCMRLRDKDLNELFKIVYYGNGHIPVDVSLTTADAADHPYEATMTQYRAVVNHCTKEAPCKGPDPVDPELTHMAMIRGKPPVSRIIGLEKFDGPTDAPVLAEDQISALDGDTLSASEMEELAGERVLPPLPSEMLLNGDLTD